MDVAKDAFDCYHVCGARLVHKLTHLINCIGDVRSGQSEIHLLGLLL